MNFKFVSLGNKNIKLFFVGNENYVVFFVERSFLLLIDMVGVFVEINW